MIREGESRLYPTIFRAKILNYTLNVTAVTAEKVRTTGLGWLGT